MTSDDYMQLEARLTKLEEVVFSTDKKFEVISSNGQFDWSLNERAFVNKYVGSLTSGTEKFVLILAYLAKGDEQSEISIKEIQLLWSKMTASSLLGIKYNGKYPTEAKTRGWVNSSKPGVYQLAYGWHEIYYTATKAEEK